ncbi:MAG: DNA polymerase IV, partial [Sphingobium sp.]
EDTFAHDLHRDQELATALAPIIERLWQRMEKAQAFGRTVTLKIKYNDFGIITRSSSLGAPVMNIGLLRETAHMLLAREYPVPKGVRLLGVGVHNMSDAEAVQVAPSRPAALGKPASQQLALAL